MSARNMVRNLRDSGVLEARSATAGFRTTALFFLSALTFGYVLYFAVSVGVPSLIEAMEKKPPPVTYAKPQDR